MAFVNTDASTKLLLICTGTLQNATLLGMPRLLCGPPRQVFSKADIALRSVLKIVTHQPHVLRAGLAVPSFVSLLSAAAAGTMSCLAGQIAPVLHWFGFTTVIDEAALYISPLHLVVYWQNCCLEDGCDWLPCRAAAATAQRAQLAWGTLSNGYR